VLILEEMIEKLERLDQERENDVEKEELDRLRKERVLIEEDIKVLI
jgi:hypothetical protein